MAPEDACVDKYLVHPQLRSGSQHQRGLDSAKLATFGFHRFTAVEVLAAELQNALGDTGAVQDRGHASYGGDMFIGVPANMALVRHLHHVGRGRIVRLNGIHQEVLVGIAARAPKRFIWRLMCFVRDSGRWLGRHGSVPLHQKMRGARLHELESLSPVTWTINRLCT